MLYSKPVFNPNRAALLQAKLRINQKESCLQQQQIFSRWLAEYERLIRHLIIGFEAEAAIQEELFQEVALNIWRAIPNFRQDSSVKTFVARITHNVLATHVTKAVKTVDTQSEGTDNIEQQSVCQQPTPYQSLDLQQRQLRLRAAIRQLSLSSQQVITLALEGMSYKEIADILGITVNTAGVRLQRAKADLARLLEQ